MAKEGIVKLESRTLFCPETDLIFQIPINNIRSINKFFIVKILGCEDNEKLGRLL